MKKTVLLLLLLCVILVGCDKREYGIMSYQNKNISARCTVNGEYEITLEQEKGICRLSVTKPERLKGISFELGTDYAKAVYKGAEITVSREHLGGICAISNIFALKEESLTDAMKKGAESVLSFKNIYGTYQVTLGKNSMPQEIIIQSPSYIYEIRVDAIEIRE